MRGNVFGRPRPGERGRRRSDVRKSVREALTRSENVGLQVLLHPVILPTEGGHRRRGRVNRNTTLSRA
jgi:hypothetical protein